MRLPWGDVNGPSAKVYRWVDANQNGVRDGIDLLIQTESKDIAVRSAATTYARSLTAGVLAGARNQGEPASLRSDLALAQGCLDARSGDASLSNKLKAAVVDTPERASAMARWKQLVDAAQLPSTLGCT